MTAETAGRHSAASVTELNPPRQSMNKWLINSVLLLGVIIAAGAGLYLGLGMRETFNPAEERYEQTTPATLLGSGEEFPDVPVMDADSVIQSTSMLLDNGGVVIFMELGCPPCSVMSDNWNGALASWKDHPPVWGISSASMDRIAHYREQLGVTFPILCDTGMVFESAYQVVDFPLQLVVDSAGIIRDASYDSRQIIDPVAIASLLGPDTTAEVILH